MTEHPAYARPTIVEAVAEIRFVKELFDPTVYGTLLQRLGSDYPVLVPEPLLQSSVEVSERGVAQRIEPGMRARFTHVDGKGTLLLSPQVLTFSLAAPYPGWEAFVSRLRAAWEAALGVVLPGGVCRLGLRYVNRIPWSPGEPVSDWIAASDLLPAKLREQRERFALRFEHSPSAGHRMALVLADATSPEGGERWLVFDLDAVLEADLPAAFTALEPELRDLHERAWHAFSVSCGPRLLRYLREETP
jgi:uncharacterized protein (TIGR04255 family)